MNYIKRLEYENKELRYAAQATADELTEIVSYLNSPKFDSDDYVNRNDLIPRLLALRLAVTP